MIRSTEAASGSRVSNCGSGVAVVVDAGPTAGYGHAVRCLRLAEALGPETPVVFHPLSEHCETFIREQSPQSAIRSPQSEIPFPPLVITDLREAHGITAKISRQGSRHISIHDLGLGQCQSDVAIDGSVTRLFPYPRANNRELHLGPRYMITRPPVKRRSLTDSVLLTFGGGSSARFAEEASQQLYRLGLKVIAARGFLGNCRMTDQEFEEAMSTCRFAICAAGVSLYEMLASGIPTLAVAFDRLQLRTADAFHELGAVLSAGLAGKLSSNTLLHHAIEMLENEQFVQRSIQTGQMLVDGKGLSRVLEIVRRQIWLTSQPKIYMTC